MGIAIIIRDDEFGLSVVAILYLRDSVTELQKTVSQRLKVIVRASTSPSGASVAPEPLDIKALLTHYATSFSGKQVSAELHIK